MSLADLRNAILEPPAMPWTQPRPHQFYQEYWYIVAVVLTVGLFCLSLKAADSSVKPNDAKPLSDARVILMQVDAATRARWRRHYGVFARQSIPFEGDYVVCPSYSPQFDSSRLIEFHDALRQHATTERVRIGPNLTKSVVIQPDRDDLQAAIRALPDLQIGSWGYIHSGNVVEVVDDDQVMLDSIWLVDKNEIKRLKDQREDELKSDAERRAEAERRQTGRRVRVDKRTISDKADFEFQFREKLADQQRDASFRTPVRLVGFPTAGLVKRMRWDGGAGSDGLQIAVVMMEEYGDAKKPKQRMVAVPARWFREGLSEAQFIDMLSKRNMTVAEFVDFMQNVKRDNPQEAEQRIFSVLTPGTKPVQR